MSVNKVIIVGRVGGDPIVNQLESGNSVGKFSVATTEKYRKNGEVTETTEWHNVVVWGKLAEICEKWVTKGMLIYASGKLKTRTYEKNKEKHFITEIHVEELKMLGSAGENKNSKPEPKKTAEPVVEPAGNNDNFEEDLPF